jgi:hypothetical protein
MQTLSYVPVDLGVNGPCITGPPVLRQLRDDRLGSWWDTAAGVASGASWGCVR